MGKAGFLCVAQGKDLRIKTPLKRYRLILLLMCKDKYKRLWSGNYISGIYITRQGKVYIC